MSLVRFPEIKWICKEEKNNILMFVCTTVLYDYMKSLRIYVHTFSDGTHVQSKNYL